MYTKHTRYSSPEARLERLKKFGNVLMTATVAAGLGAAVGTALPVKKVSAEQANQEIIAKQLSNFAISNKADDAALRAEIERSLLISASAAIYANTSETIIDGYIDEIVDALFIQLREAGTPVGVNDMSAVVAIDGHDIAFNLEIFVYDDTQAFLEDNRFVILDQASGTQEMREVTYKVQTGELLSTVEPTSDGESQQIQALTQVQNTLTLVASDSNGNDHINVLGTSAPYTTVTVTWPDGTQTYNIPVDAEGNWTVESPKPQNSGRLSAIAIDEVGNGSSPVSSQYVDVTPPAQPTIYASDADNDRFPTASGGMIGEFQLGTTITVTWPDGTMTEGIPLDAVGNWTVESSSQQVSGNIMAHAVDPAGNTSPEVTAPWEADFYAQINFDTEPINASNIIYKGQLFDVSGTVTDVEDGQAVKLEISNGGGTSKVFNTIVENGKWKVVGIDSSDFNLGVLGMGAATYDLAGNAAMTVWLTVVSNLPNIDVFDAQTVVEGESSQFIIGLETAFDYDVEITYQTQSGTASQGSDFIGKTGVLILEAGQSFAVVDVETLDDSLDEADEEHYNLRLLSAKALINNQLLSLPLARTQAQASIEDNDSSSFVIDTKAIIHINPLTSIYESQDLTITGYVEDVEDGQKVDVTLMTPLGDKKTYQVSIVNGQWSISNIDYSGFLAGEAVALTVAAVTTDQAGNTTTDTEVFTLLPLPTVSISNNQTVKEGQQAQFVLSLDQAQPYDIYISFESLAATALSDEDFQSLTGGVWIKAGQKQVTVFVTTLQDKLDEADEDFIVRILSSHLDLDRDGQISEGSDLATHIISPATATILDDDESPVPSDTEHTNSITIESIATDNHLTLLEQGQEKTIIRGRALLPEDTAEHSLLLKIHDQTYLTSVNSDGSWSVEAMTPHLLQDEDWTIHAYLTSKDSADNIAESYHSLSYALAQDTEALEDATLAILHVAEDDHVSLAEQEQETALIGGRFNLPTDVRDASLVLLLGNTSYLVELQADGFWQVRVRLGDLLADSDHLVTAILSVIDQAGNSGTLTQTRAYSIEEKPEHKPVAPKEPDQIPTVETIKEEVKERKQLPLPQVVQVPQENGEDFELELISEKPLAVTTESSLPETGETLDWTLSASGIALLALVALLKRRQSLKAEKE